MAQPVSVSLHVGVHKTASTHIQKTLMQNRAVLAETKLRFVGPEFLREPGQSLTALFGLGEKPPLGGRDPQAQLRWLAGKRGRGVVISEENALGAMLDGEGPAYPMADLKIEKLAKALAPSPLRLYVALRDPAGWMASVYRHKLFNGALPTFQDFSRGHDPAQMRWSNLIERLRRVSGIEALYVWRHEDYPAVAAPVFRRMLGWKLGPRIERIEREVNVGLSHKAVEQLLAWGPMDDPRSAARQARALYPVTNAASRFDPWPEAVKAASAAAYAEDMARIEAAEGVTVLRPSLRAATLAT